ncbi:uncharacterized protein [Bos taurus]|uniref:uncharacterized protein n=1 Tax=Bos taurus TaxID=9913 RepID=UPI00023ADCA9|nr:uncharacterized protein LOC100337108 [Bos taurus]XP_014338078.1 PREDICTED: uncharacterized protein LOC102285490 [Bos mutus]
MVQQLGEAEAAALTERAKQFHQESTVSTLPTDLQVASSERCERVVTPKRFMTPEMARGFSLFKEALLVFEAQDSNVEQYTKVAAAVENAIQCYRVIYEKKKGDTAQTTLDRKTVDEIESSKESESVSSMSVSEIVTCVPSPIADDPSAPPSPTSCQ